MPQSLVHEFLERRESGNTFCHSLKEAIFQAKPPDLEAGEEDGEKFQLWKVRMRGLNDEEPVDWWFASTGIPILAATLGPLANVLSIGALVTFWRLDLSDPAHPGQLLPQTQGTLLPDPRWCYWVNVFSLVLGFVGNLFLLLNFTQRVRYLISLPMTIILWYIACGMLIGDLAGMHLHAPPIKPNQTYSGGFWYGIAACCMYLLLSMMLMVNLVGYVRGHYPQHFTLTEDQRTLIVQTMLFFIWLAGGAGVYSRLEGWHFIDALYYCDVTILTVGYGDLYPTETAGRAILIPYSIGGIIMLGLVISAIYKSVSELGEKNIVRHHFEQQRARTKDHTVRSSLEMHRKEIEMELAQERAMAKQAARPSARSTGTGRKFQQTLESKSRRASMSSGIFSPQLSRQSTMQSTLKKNKQIVLLKEEKDRFEAMRKIQKKSEVWRHWYRLTVTLTIFALFWCVGAIFFWQAEMDTLGMDYWETIYFCWVSLLSIGYGDFSPKSGAGRCFFLIWSLMAVPTMTILASDLTSTVVSVFNSWSNGLADLTILPQAGLWHDLMDRFPWLFLHLPEWLEKRAEAAAKKSENSLDAGKTMETERSMSTQISKDDEYAAGTLKADFEGIVTQHNNDIVKQPDATALSRQLALAIRRTAHDLRLEKPREYTYEEWVEFTRLIRFSAMGGTTEALRDDEEEGMIEWDWIGEDSPMMANQSETEFVLERLCESLVRYLKRNPPVGLFADVLKQKGEDALKLKGGSASEEDGVSGGASVFSGQDTKSLKSVKGSIVSGLQGGEGATVGGLHPLEEEDHEIHEIR